MQERLERVPFPRPVHVAFPQEAERPHRCVAGNISFGGMFVRGEHRPKEGTPLSLSLEAKGKLYPFAEGEVVWRADPEVWAEGGRVPGFGVRFTRFLHPRAGSLIEHMLARQAAPLPPEVGEQVVGAPEPAPSPVSEETPSFVVEPGFAPVWIGAGLGGKELDLELPSGIPHAAPVEPPPSRVGAAAAMVTALVAIAVGGVFFARSRVESLPQADAQTVIAAPARPGALAAAAPAEVQGEATAPAETEAEVENAKAPRVIPAPAPPQVAAASPAQVPAAAAAPTPAVAVPPAAPVPAAPAPAPAPAAMKPSPSPARLEPAKPSVTGQAHLPSGAAASLSWRQSREGSVEVKVSLADGAQVERVFALSAPSRLVIDLSHVRPDGSARVDGDGALVSAVRVGAREDGTRLVLDLSAPVAKVESQDASSIRFTLAR